MSNIIKVNFREKPKPYNADVFTEDMCRLRLETVATNSHKACLQMISTTELQHREVKCIVIYLGFCADRKETDEVLLTYFPKKGACNE